MTVSKHVILNFNLYLFKLTDACKCKVNLGREVLDGATASRMNNLK